MGSTAFLEPQPGEPMFHVRWLRHGWAEQVKNFPESETVELVASLTSDPNVTRVQIIPSKEGS